MARTIMLVFALLISCDCGSLPPVNWPHVAQCAVDAIPDVIAAVSRILLADGPGQPMAATSKSELEQLARDKGADAVACAVSTLKKDWTSPGRAQDDNTIAASQRARAFLSANGIAEPPSAPPAAGPPQ